MHEDSKAFNKLLPHLKTAEGNFLNLYNQNACAIAKDQVKLEADGSWKLIVALKNPGAKNWLDTT